MKNFILTLAGLALVFALSSCAQNMTYTVKLSAENEVVADGGAKPDAPDATAEVTVTLDEGAKTISVDGTYSSLTGAATAAHIHGPASKTENAGSVFTLTVTEGDTAGSGTVSLSASDITDAQITDLKDGKYYINIHTATHAAGEIRGQIE